MPLYHWSETAATNASADPTVNFAEGQAPSSLNDSNRAVMSVLKKWSNDISGVIVTTGTSTAYAVTSHSVFDTLAHLDGQIIAFAPHTTSTGTATLNVDGLGAKPLRSAPSTEILSGVLIQGTPYICIYSNADGAFYLHGFYGQPLNVPLFAGMDYWHTVAPNSSFIFPAGQAISRATFAAAFAAWGTTYGAGDGSTTFNVPDKTERVSVMKAAVATRLTTAGSGVDGATMGATGGTQNVSLAANQIPSLTSVNASQAITVTSTVSDVLRGGVSDNFTSIAGSGEFDNLTKNTITSTGNNSISVTYTNGSQAVTKTVPPTIVCNYIIRII